MTQRDEFAGRTLIEVLQGHAERFPGALAYKFLADGEDNAIDITYAELDRKARVLAGYLQSLRMQGERALLLYPQGIDYLVAFWGCLYAQVVAIPLYPPSPKPRVVSRMLAIARNARCKIALGTRQILSASKSVFDQMPELEGLERVATDELADDRALDWRGPAAGPETLAYLQYTSGSTSTPKGVMISHGNLLRNVAFIQRTYRFMSGESVFVTWAPFFHDMGLILGTLLPLCVRFPCILMSPASFAQRPVRWLSAISRFGGTASFGSNFAYDICVDTISAAQREALDLGKWNIAINGSEPVRARTLERFAQAYRPRGFRMDAFRAGYGLAEATLAVSCGHKPGTPPVRILRVSSAALERGEVVEAADDSVQGKDLVSCGLVNAEDTVVIADPVRKTPCAPGRIGEIWVAGGSVALGYWERPGETEETFGARLADTGGGPFLRTGDLGFLRDGELYVTGRVKDLIIVRGRNLYPHDIELTVEASHPGVRRGAGAAFSVDTGDEERLVIVQEIQHGQNINAEAIAVAARRAVVNEYEVQPHAIVLVRPGSIHKTTSGKIQRYACREAYLKGALAVYEP